ncbi:hypothetical protein KIW84_025087 [Lathyrus oleraceus]|uniref:Uncharacterized protein n=1 Tax=Pisum sativum TaxID=3888 RepID=A0A9D4YH88_PEA|nr:hypothetical protein KIW84_025087 [Pisum sativum]
MFSLFFTHAAVTFFSSVSNSHNLLLQNTTSRISPYFPSTSENPSFRLQGSLRRHPNNRPPHSPLTSEPPPFPPPHSSSQQSQPCRYSQNFLCANAKAKFDETVEAHIKPGIDSKRTELGDSMSTM